SGGLRIDGLPSGGELTPALRGQRDSALRSSFGILISACDIALAGGGSTSIFAVWTALDWRVWSWATGPTSSAVGLDNCSWDDFGRTFNCDWRVGSRIKASTDSAV
ncbi:MAG: hypothetical protein O6948_00215, partial [Deltaproteobacteria bacterium]|nr:hypothetical protein [Deltaproteobacteria bacterium]